MIFDRQTELKFRWIGNLNSKHKKSSIHRSDILHIKFTSDLYIHVIQFLFTVFTGQVNDNLKIFGASLARYVYNCLLFVTYNSDDKPFPFGEWPAAEGSLAEVESAPVKAKPAAKPKSKAKPKAKPKAKAKSKAKSKAKTDSETDSEN